MASCAGSTRTAGRPGQARNEWASTFSCLLAHELELAAHGGELDNLALVADQINAWAGIPIDPLAPMPIDWLRYSCVGVGWSWNDLRGCKSTTGPLPPHLV